MKMNGIEVKNTGLRDTYREMTYRVVTNDWVNEMSNSVIASGYPMLKLYTPMDDSLKDAKVKLKDINRAWKLSQAPACSGHDCFLKGVLVSFDLTLSLKCWTEAERYGFLNFVSSMSSLKLAETNSDICFIEYTDRESIKVFRQKMKEYQNDKTRDNWLKMVYSMPTGLLLSARMTTNYMQLKTIYNQRRTHRLPDWQEFCDWIEYLPNSGWITGELGNKEGA